MPCGGTLSLYKTLLNYKVLAFLTAAHRRRDPIHSLTMTSLTHEERLAERQEETASEARSTLELSSDSVKLVHFHPAPEKQSAAIGCYAQQINQASLSGGQARGAIIEAEPPPLCDSKRELVQQWLKRPARRQVLDSEVESISHCEGQNEYNIWYGRHLTDRYSRPSHLDRDAALYRCDPELDAGYTAADTHPGSSEAYFCAFFAKGCCTKGSECRYKHRIPTLEDECSLEWSRDIFGRERHRDHRDDMSGAGSFNHECRTLFVGGLQIDPAEEDGIQSLEKFLWETFGAWGDVESVRVIPKKLIGFVTFAYRVQAEFAKVAMADQNFGKHGSLLSVKWAHQDGNAKRKKESEDLSKKLKMVRPGQPSLSNQTQQSEEETVRQTLESYCSAWQAYWAAVCEGGKPTCDVPLNKQHGSFPHANMLGGRQDSCSFGAGVAPWLKEESPAGDEETQRLLNALSRVEGLSTADFLEAGVVRSCNS